MRFFNLYKASQGQSLAEYALIAGIVSIGCIAGLSLFSGNLADALSTFQKSVIPTAGSSINTLANSPGTNNSGLTTVNPSTGTTVVGGAASLTPAELSQLQTQNQQIQQLYSAVLNGTASPAEVAGSFGESSSQIYAMAQKLTQLAAEVQATDPAKASQILELAKTGKILSGMQSSVGSEYQALMGAAYDNNGVVNPSFKAADDFHKKLSIETQTLINGWQPDGTFVGDYKTGDIVTPSEAITQAQAWTTTFNQQYMALQGTLGQYNLSSTGESTLNNAAIEILAKSGTYTFENALNTYDKSKTIETVQTAP